MSDDLYQRLKPLSPKARASIKADGWMTVWEGAIRSGKTVASLIAFLAYIERSKEKRFIMSGKTYTSLVRNAIDGDFGLLALGAPHLRLCKDRSGSDVVTYRDKKIYLVGAADSTSSAARIPDTTATFNRRTSLTECNPFNSGLSESLETTVVCDGCTYVKTPLTFC